MIWWLVSRTPLISGCSQSCDLIFYWMLHDPKKGQMIFKKQINQTLDWWRSTAEGRACWCSPSCRPPPTKAGVCTCACPLVLLCNVPFLPAMLNLFCFMSRYNSLKKKKKPWTTSSACAAVDVVRPSPTAGEYLRGGCRIGSIRVWFGVCWGMRNWT